MFVKRIVIFIFILPLIFSFLFATDSENTTLISRFDTEGRAGEKIIRENYLYLTDYDEGLRILDISDPKNPAEVGFYNPDQDGFDNHIKIIDNYAYVTNSEQGLQIIDISDPTNPVLKKSLSEEYLSLLNIYDFAISGNYAYFCIWKTYDTKGIKVLDISDPANPDTLPDIDQEYFSGSMLDMASDGNYLYIGDDEALRVIDISDPYNPAEIKAFDPEINFWTTSIFIKNTYLYLTDYAGGLHIIDITNPSSPIKEGFYEVQYAKRVAVSDDYIYLGTKHEGVRVLDISDISEPFEAGYFETDDNVTDIKIFGGKVYISADQKGIYIIRNDLIEGNTPPIASFSVEPQAGDITTKFIFDATRCSDTEDNITDLKVRWDWENDGIWDTNFSSDKIEEHQYSSYGNYDVTLEVHDSEGLTDTTTNQIAVSAQGLIAYYPFTGNALDESGNGNHGELKGPSNTVDRFGNQKSAFEFDGWDDWIKIDTIDYNILSKYSVSVWIHPDKYSSNNQAIINNSKHDNGKLDMIGLQLLNKDHPNYPNKIQFFHNDSTEINGADSITTDRDFQISKWIHIVIVNNGDSLKIYYDGQLDNALINVTQNSITNKAFWKIGKLNDINGNYFDGKIDDIRIYNKAITENKIKEIFNNGRYPLADFSVSPDSGSINTEFTFDATASTDPQDNSSELKVRWDWNGDNIWDTNYSNSKTATHQYETPGIYMVQIEVKNTLGLTDIENKQIIVSKGITNKAITDVLTLYADNIEETGSDNYLASGNVRIGNDEKQLLYFSGDVTLNKTAAPVLVTISGDCDIYVGPEKDHEIINDMPFLFNASDNKLSMTDYLSSLFSLCGFSVNFLGLEFDFENSSINMPSSFAFKTDFLQEAEVSSHFSVILPIGKDRSYEGEIQFENFNIFNLFELSLLRIYYEKGPPEVIGGEAEISWPASEIGGDGLAKINSNPDSDVEFKVVDEYSKDTVYVEELDQVDPKILESMGLPFSGLGIKLEFVSGQLNTIVLSVDTEIPLGNSGLYLTQLTGGVGDLVTQPWWFTLGCDISGGPEIPASVPGLGGEYIVQLDDITATLWPVSRFEGTGTLALVGYQLAGGGVTLAGDTLLAVEGNVSLGLDSMIYGEAFIKLKPGYFAGSISSTLKIPDNLPWYLSTIEGKIIAERNVNLSLDSDVGYPIATTSATLPFLPDPHVKLTFNNPNPPFFHCYIGTNFEDLTKLFKPLAKKADSDQHYFSFYVSEPFKDIMIAVKDSLDTESSITIITPKNQEINSNNISSFGGLYLSKEDVRTLSIDGKNVVEGNWELIVNTESPINDIQYKLIAESPKSSIRFINPTTKQTNSNKIEFQISNPAKRDLTYELYYDHDRKSYNGYLLYKNFTSSNNTFAYTINQNEISPGEYYFYVILRDNKDHAYYSNYSTGSILIDNNSSLPIPENLNYTLKNDSLNLSWNKISNSSQFDYYQLNIQNKKTNKNKPILISKDISHYSLDTTLIKAGSNYKIWLQTTDNNEHSRKSNPLELSYITDNINNSPVINYSDTTLNVFPGNDIAYNLTASDADEDPLSFSVKADNLNISVSGNKINWAPDKSQIGNYFIKAYVSDGKGGSDSTNIRIIVREQENYEPSIKFTSSFFPIDDIASTIITDKITTKIIELSYENLNNGINVTKEGNKAGFGEYHSHCSLEDLNPSPGDTIEALYTGSDGQTYATRAMIIAGETNNPPSAFSLLAPTYGDTLFLANEADSSEFKWQSSIDIDENDNVQYMLNIGNIILIKDLSDTLTIIKNSILSELRNDQNDVSLSTYWSVKSISNNDTVNCNYKHKIIFDFENENVIPEDELIPDNYRLHQNYPNPFNQSTIIKFELPNSSHIDLTIYDLTGNKIETLINQDIQAGYHLINWYTKNIPSGIYLYKLKAENFVDVKKCIIMK